MDNIKNKITFLYTNIGRGHPFYLDGIIEAAIRHGEIKFIRQQSDVFDISRGLSLIGWKAVRWLYRKGSQDGFVSGIYRKIRKDNDYNQPGLLLSLIGKHIKNEYLYSKSPMIVAHPVLVAILRGKPGLFYQHGEVITPREAVVKGAEKVFVPTKDAAQPFYDIGYSENDIVITGLCIEPSLVRQADDTFDLRMRRLSEDVALTGGFFSSGAEPVCHVTKLLKAATSAVKGGGRVIIFAVLNKTLFKKTIEQFNLEKLDFQIIDSSNNIPKEIPPALLVGFNSRQEENIFTARLFNYLDYFVAPSHERTNWALGLGLPMFILEPSIGPFSPLNKEFLLKNKVAVQLENDDQAESFDVLIRNLKDNGELKTLAQNGRGKFNIDGFEKIIYFLNNY